MRRALGSLLLLAALAGTTYAVAENRRATRPRGGGKAAVTAPKSSHTESHEARPEARPDVRPEARDERTPAPADEPVPLEVVDGGAATRATSSVSDGGARSSPLNPRADEFADAGVPMSAAELERVMGEIAALRGRIAAVSDVLFKSHLLIRIETRGDHASISKLSVSLDEGVVYSAPARFSADEPVTVYERAVAPGRHSLLVHVERRDDRGESFRSQQESRFALEVPENQRLEAVVRIDDDSNMGADFPADQRGTYELRVRVRAQAFR
jgi:hypothetical protein